MKLQKTFKESYMKSLRDKVISGVNIPLYAGESFELEEKMCRPLANVYEPIGLPEKLVATREGDFSSAIALFEAYPNLSPLVASNEAFWAYLTHTTMFNYAQERWPEVKSKEVTSNYILDHWFVQNNNLFRNAASNLWWSVYNTVDDQRENPYELTEILFSNQTLRVRTLGTYQLIRHREAMLGILSFIADNKEIMNGNFEERGNFISKYFNRLGAVKQLAYMDREYFYSVCQRKINAILSINSTGDDKKEDLYEELF